MTLQEIFDEMRRLSGALSDLVDDHAEQPAPPMLRRADQAVAVARNATYDALMEGQSYGSNDS